MTDDHQSDALEANSPENDSLEPLTQDIPTITLNDAVKLAGFAQTGGQAKVLIQSGQVKVNGTVETRRKRKLREGDSLEVGGEEVVLGLEGQA